MGRESPQNAHATHARGVNHRWKALGGGFAANASFSAAFSGLPTTAVFLRSGYHVGNSGLGLVLGMMGLGIALSELPWGLLTDRWGGRRVLLLGLGSTAAALAAMACFVVPHGASVPGLAMLGGVCASAWHGVAFTELATLAGTSRAGTALAMGNTFAFLTLFVTPLAIPLLLSVGSWPMVWAVARVFALIALPVFPRAVAARARAAARV